MNRKQKNKLLGIVVILALLCGAFGLVLYALKQNINLFYTPTQLANQLIPETQSIRVGGYVKHHSVQYNAHGTDVAFAITDHLHEIAVDYHGVLPNLFREGQGVVVTGHLHAQTFIADQVLAKHDEKYMPWPLVQELKKNGVAHAS